VALLSVARCNLGRKAGRTIRCNSSIQLSASFKMNLQPKSFRSLLSVSINRPNSTRNLLKRFYSSSSAHNSFNSNNSSTNFKHSDWSSSHSTSHSSSGLHSHLDIPQRNFSHDSLSSNDAQKASQGVENVVIIGSGAAGLTAAIYNARANLTPLVIEGEQPGGQLTITSDVENYPGFSEPIVGPKLMETMRLQAEKFGTRYIQANVVAVDMKARPIELKLSDDSVIRTHSLIIATGAVAKWLGVPGEAKYQGKGVSACATCDGFFFKNKDIAVVGGGDTALEEATFLTRFAKSVTLIHRRSTLRASAAMQKKAQSNPKIKFLWNSSIKEICGDNKKVEKIIVTSTENGAESELQVQGVFVAIGHEPNSKLFINQLPMNEHGYLLRENGEKTNTKLPGVFVAGDVSDHVYRQAITAAGMGCQAAIDAQHYLETLEK
jgi:thioredoxin reductase (NADPH)